MSLLLKLNTWFLKIEMKTDYFLEVFLGKIRFLSIWTMTLARGAEMQTEEYAKARLDKKKKNNITNNKSLFDVQEAGSQSRCQFCQIK